MKSKFVQYLTGSHARVWRSQPAGLLLSLLVPLASYGLPSSANTNAILEAGPIQIRVQCGNSTAPVKSIADGLKLLGNLHPAVLLISGTCRENVTIQGLEDITLQGNPTATIDGSVNPDADTVQITQSLNIALSNLTITGSSNGAGVDCLNLTYCLLTQVTMQNNSAGAGVSGGARLESSNCVFQNNGDGVDVGFGSALLTGGSITGNNGDGVFLGNAAVLVAGGGIAIQNNGGNGITTVHHDTIRLTAPAAVTGNAGDGITLQMASTLIAVGSTITNNGGHQVRIGDLSIAQFSARDTISGTHYPDVVCDPQFSTTRNLAQLNGTTSNCPAEQPPTP